MKCKKLKNAFQGRLVDALHQAMLRCERTSKRPCGRGGGRAKYKKSPRTNAALIHLRYRDFSAGPSDGHARLQGALQALKHLGHAQHTQRGGGGGTPNTGERPWVHTHSRHERVEQASPSISRQRGMSPRTLTTGPPFLLIFSTPSSMSNTQETASPGAICSNRQGCERSTTVLSASKHP